MNLSHQKASIIFNKLYVNAIENSSGIFIGTNQAIGWSNYSKSNQGFGSVKNATVSHMVNVLNDQDMVDSPMADEKELSISSVENAAQQCALAFQAVNANSLGTNSTISIGENDQNAWSDFHKSNYGNGKYYGLNRLKHIANLIQDNDYIDTPANLLRNSVENISG